jgi:hypothetical protein
VTRAAGQIPDQPAIDGPERDLAALGAVAQAGHAIEHPADLRRREIRIEQQAGPPAHLDLEPAFAQRGASGGRAAILPDDRVLDRTAGGALPQQRRFALIGDADRCDLRGLDARVAQRTAGRFDLRTPQVGGVVFDPARLRIELRKLGLIEPANRALMVEDDRARARRSLVQRENVGGVGQSDLLCGERSGRERCVGCSAACGDGALLLDERRVPPLLAGAAAANRVLRGAGEKFAFEWQRMLIERLPGELRDRDHRR